MLGSETRRPWGVPIKSGLVIKMMQMPTGHGELINYLRQVLFGETGASGQSDVVTLERFRTWYETRRMSTNSYGRHIASFPRSYKVVALKLFLHLWREQKDLRHLNFCLKLQDDILNPDSNGTNGNSDVIQELSGQLSEELLRLYERFGIS